MKKFLSLLLAVMMIISVLPTAAFADGMKTLDMAPVGEVYTPAEGPAKEPVQETEQPAEQEQPIADDGAVLIKNLVVSKPGTKLADVEKYALTPEFDSNTKDYTIVIPDNINNFFVWAELFGKNDVAECKYHIQDGTLKRTVKLSSTKGAPLPLFIKISRIEGNTATIVSYDGKTEDSKTEYTLTVKRRATLRSLNLSESANPGEKIVLSEAFDGNTTKYTGNQDFVTHVLVAAQVR